MKNTRYRIEAAIAHMLMLIFAVLPLDLASALGGWLGRKIGGLIANKDTVYKNLGLAFPHLSDLQKGRIWHEMLDNIGRTAAEYKHLHKIGRERIVLQNEEIFTKIINSGEGAVFISGHLANWEINGPTLFERFGILINVTYRRPNNPYIAKMLDKARSLDGKIPTYAKQRSTGKEIINILKDKGLVGILVDQKFNEGVAVPFFGIDAMTSPIFVRLCQKYRCPLVPVRNRRLKGAHFETTLHAPLTLFDENNSPLPVETVLADIHALLEDWIREEPGQWLWLHRRWPKSLLS